MEIIKGRLCFKADQLMHDGGSLSMGAKHRPACHELLIMSHRVAIHAKIINSYDKYHTSVSKGNDWWELTHLTVAIAMRDSAGNRADQMDDGTKRASGCI